MFSSCGLVVIWAPFFFGGGMGCHGCLQPVPHAVIFFQSHACISDWGLAIEHLNHKISNQNLKNPD